MRQVEVPIRSRFSPLCTGCRGMEETKVPTRSNSHALDERIVPTRSSSHALCDAALPGLSRLRRAWFHCDMPVLLRALRRGSISSDPLQFSCPLRHGSVSWVPIRSNSHALCDLCCPTSLVVLVPIRSNSHALCDSSSPVCTARGIRCSDPLQFSCPLRPPLSGGTGCPCTTFRSAPILMPFATAFSPGPVGCGLPSGFASAARIQTTFANLRSLDPVSAAPVAVYGFERKRGFRHHCRARTSRATDRRTG